MMDKLPHEIIEYILCNEIITTKELYALMRTCHYLKELIAENDVLWRLKFMQRWPQCLSVSQKDAVDNWKTEYMNRLQYGQIVCNGLKKVIIKYHQREVLPKKAISEFASFAIRDSNALSHLKDELYLLSGSNKHLSHSYYSKRLLRLLCQCTLRQEWNAWLKSNTELDIPLEQGAEFIAKWIQFDRDLRSLNVIDKLNNLTRAVLDLLSKHYPNLAILQQPVNISLENICKENMWPSHDCRIIIEAIIQKLNELGFKIEASNELYLQLIHTAVEKKEGTEPIMALIMASIAHRLGVGCQITFCRSPYKFLLRFVEHPEMSRDEDRWTYVDITRTKFLSPFEASRTYGVDTTQNVMPLQIFQQILEILSPSRANVEQMINMAELKLFLSPMNPNHIRRVFDYYWQCHINKKETALLDSRLKTMIAGGLVTPDMPEVTESTDDEDDDDEDDEVRPRSLPKFEEVQYSVGMVMVHRRYGYDCVIAGWTPTCLASQEWIRQMGVNRLPKKDKQPFYNVLVSDESIRYAAQENLDFHPKPVMITNSNIGRYFETFTGTHYELNDGSKKYYPEDSECTEKMVKSRYDGVDFSSVDTC